MKKLTARPKSFQFSGVEVVEKSGNFFGNSESSGSEGGDGCCVGIGHAGSKHRAEELDFGCNVCELQGAVTIELELYGFAPVTPRRVEDG